MILSVLGTSGYTVFAEDILDESAAPVAEEVVTAEPEEATPAEEETVQGESPGEETIEAATPNGGSGIIKGNLDLNAYTLPAYYTYAVHFNNHSTDRTAYAKGFVTIKHADGTYTTEYSEPIMSAVIPAYD